MTEKGWRSKLLVYFLFKVGKPCFIIVSPLPERDNLGKDVLSATRCLKSSDLRREVEDCKDALKPVQDEVEHVEETSWTTLALSAANAIGVVTNIVLTCYHKAQDYKRRHRRRVVNAQRGNNSQRNNEEKNRQDNKRKLASYSF